MTARERFSAPWRPLPGAPLGLAFFSPRGLYCVVVELVLFSPCVAYALRRRPARQSGA